MFHWLVVDELMFSSSSSITSLAAFIIFTDKNLVGFFSQSSNKVRGQRNRLSDEINDDCDDTVFKISSLNETWNVLKRTYDQMRSRMLRERKRERDKGERVKECEGVKSVWLCVHKSWEIRRKVNSAFYEQQKLNWKGERIRVRPCEIVALRSHWKCLHSDQCLSQKRSFFRSVT